jgi:glycosyltransferase involved in cell wall biosynthesis
MRFTILTPTYNRVKHLPRVFETLCSQTFTDFEWVIVDDGSTDGTRELVSSWQSSFTIRYFWKVNGGKHTAVNIGVAEAAGDFVAILDSDDRLVPNALARLDYHWKQIPNPERFANLVCLCYSEDGSILGSPLSRDHVDVFNVWDNIVLCDAERWGMVRRDVLRQFPYPVFKNERFILEGVVWNRIHKRHASRFINEPLRIVGHAADSLTAQGDMRYSSPKGAVVYHSEMAFSNAPMGLRIKSGITSVYFAFVAMGRELGMFASRIISRKRRSLGAENQRLSNDTR